METVRFFTHRLYKCSHTARVADRNLIQNLKTDQLSYSKCCNAVAIINVCARDPTLYITGSTDNKIPPGLSKQKNRYGTSMVHRHSWSSWSTLSDVVGTVVRSYTAD